MTPQMQEAKTIELLGWMKSHGMAPKHIQRNDRYLCSITRRVILGRHLQEHQKQRVYWLPTKAGLLELGIRVEQIDMGSLTAFKAGPFIGAGPGESEAALSVLNQMRLTFAS